MATRPIYEQTLSADGATNWVKVKGPVYVEATGDFGSGTITLQRKNTAGTAVTVPSSSTYTDDFAEVMDFPPGVLNEVRVNLASSTSPTIAVAFQWDASDVRERH